MIHYIGIDVSKHLFHACFDEHGEISQFHNDIQGINSFLRYLKEKSYLPKNTLIGLESTGSYHLALSFFAFTLDYTIHVINPLIVKKQNQTSLRRVKTDSHDARIIRYCLITGAGYPFQDTVSSLIIKTLVRQRACFSTLRLHTRLKDEEVKHRESYLNSPITTVNAELCSFLDQKIKALDIILRKYHPDLQKLLKSIPGIGPQTAVTLLSEIRDIKRFSHPEKLVAYIGLDPRVHLSGTSIHGKGYITKRGNKLLRTRLYNAASVAVLHPNIFQDFFQKKRSEGKFYRVALCAVMRKMVHVIHAVWSRGTPFINEKI